MKTQVLIVGGGVAGLSTACFLARSGASVTVLEREAQFGTHSSGKNAAILRTLTADPFLTELGRESARFLDAPPDGFAEHPIIDRCGLILTAGGTLAEQLRAWAARGDAFSAATELSSNELARRVPDYAGPADCALLLADEGRLDVAAMMGGFERLARAAGAQLRTRATVSELLREGSEIRGVRLENGEELLAEQTCIAAGGWAPRLGAQAGSRIELRPTRRHLAVTGADPRVDPRAPVLWAEHFYCRPESGGWLLCACDQVDVEPDECLPDDSVLESIARETALHLPRFADTSAEHFWCGMRTLTADGRFAVGPDPDLSGLFWVAGLGGHGMTASAEVGRRAAQQLLGGEGDARLDPARLAPARPHPGRSDRTSSSQV